MATTITFPSTGSTAITRMSQKIIKLVTGNVNKLNEVQHCLRNTKSITIEHVKLDLPEYQGEPAEIAEQKCKEAFEKVKGPVMVEDTSLCYNALGGLPGPYIKWFLEKIGTDGLYDLLEAYSDKTAVAKCIFAYKESEQAGVELIVGTCNGTIVRPRGSTNFGWDPCFLPDGCTKTFAEMSNDDKNMISHRANALKKLQQTFENKYNVDNK